MSMRDPTDAIVYKICSASDWREAEAAGVYLGSADDSRDGFIHLSSADQVPETAKKYFSGKPDLVMIAIATRGLGDALRWEVSRNGELFPHLYAPLPTSTALWVRPLPLDPSGRPTVPDGLPRC